MRLTILALEVYLFRPNLRTDHDARDLSLELEYIGPDLSHFVDGYQMSQLSDVLRQRIWIDVSRGLKYIHGKNILHLEHKAPEYSSR